MEVYGLYLNTKKGVVNAMSKKRRFAGVTAVLIFFIGLWSMSALHTCIETNENLDADVPEDLGVVIEGLDAEKNRTETSQYGSGYGLIQAEHVNIISYPDGLCEKHVRDAKIEFCSDIYSTFFKGYGTLRSMTFSEQ